MRGTIDRMSRRRLLVGATGAAAAILAACGRTPPTGGPDVPSASPAGVTTTVAAPSAAATALRGRPTGVRLTGRSGGIAGFADRVSAASGETVTLRVKSATPYAIEVYRLGWYDGGASAATFVAGISRVPRQVQPDVQRDLITGLVSAANWIPGPTLDTHGWASGLYVCKLLGGDSQSYIPLVIRDDQTAHDVLFIHAANTDQAYNGWGGKSLYESTSSGEPTVVGTIRAAKVSFDRPYDRDGTGANFLGWELNMVRWLEREGFAIGYAADTDLHANPDRFDARARAVLMAGHSEYWSRAMRDGLEAARVRGRGLGFFTGDTGSWAVRFEPSSLGMNRVLVCYKDAAHDPEVLRDPASATVLWSESPLNRSTHRLMGLGTNGPMRRSADWKVVGAAAESGLFAGTGLADGNVVPALVGYEYDGLWTPGASGEPPAGLQTLGIARVATERPVTDDLQFAIGLDLSPNHRIGIGQIEMSVAPKGWWMLSLRVTDGETDAYIQYLPGTNAPQVEERDGISYGILPLGMKFLDPPWQPFTRDLRADYATAFGRSAPDTLTIEAVSVSGAVQIGSLRIIVSQSGSELIIPVQGLADGAQWHTIAGNGSVFIEDGGPQGDKVLTLQPAQSSRPIDESQTVVVRSPTGGMVIAVGSIQWSWALDDAGKGISPGANQTSVDGNLLSVADHTDATGRRTDVDARVQALTRNMVRALLGSQ